MITVNMHEAKSRLSQLVEAVENNGDTVTICRNGKPVAVLAQFPHPEDRLTPDPALRVALDYDPISPLAADEIPEDYR